MELQAMCIGYKCQHAHSKNARGKCKLVKKKNKQQCPVYHYTRQQIAIVPTSRFQSCPSCNGMFIITEYGGDIYCNSIWGTICGYCLYQFNERGWPIGQTPISAIKKRVDIKDINDHPAWDIVY